MKRRLWTPTLAWIAAVLVAVLLALAAPESLGLSASGFEPEIPNGALTPR